MSFRVVCPNCGSLWNNAWKGKRGKSFFCSKCGFETSDKSLKKVIFSEI